MQQNSKIEEVTESVKEYINTRYELVVLQTAEKTSNVGSQLISFSVLAIVSVLALVFLSIALAWYISDQLESPQAGFFIVGGFYLLMTLVFFFFRKQVMVKPFRNIIIRSIFNED